MSETKHTPGPWGIEKPCAFPYSGTYITAGVKYGHPFYVCQIRETRGFQESDANACLIAAAPRLLEAGLNLYKAVLAAMVCGVSMPKPLLEQAEAMRAAIVKAQGRQV